MNKGHRTVFQMPEAKKTNTLIEKTILFQEKLINSSKEVWKRNFRVTKF